MIGSFFLDSIFSKIENLGETNKAINDLFLCLKQFKSILSPKKWENFSSSLCLNHPIKKILHQDPLTFRAFSKPRGYAGDAVMLDLIYQEPEINDLITNLSPLAKKIYDYTSQSPASLAVKLRRDLLAQKIDEIALSVSSPEILSLACGHLREGRYSKALQQRQIKKFIAFDQDQESLKEVEKNFAPYGVETWHGKISQIIKNEIKLDKFDFIYAAGLFDYLKDNTAVQLCQKMFSALKPQGKMLIANFTKKARDLGYMESFMDWKLICRSKPEMLELLSCLPQQEIKEKNIFIEKHQSIAFLEVQKK